MSAFTGFDGWMFEFLVRDDQDTEEKRLIRRTMERFGDRILHDRNGLKKLDSVTYESAQVGNFSSGDDHFWIAFGPEKFRERCHQTISLYDYGVDVFVNVELRPAVDLLRRRIEAQEWTFKSKIAALPGRFTVRIEERRKRGEQPRAFDYYGIAELNGGDCKEGQGGHYGLKDPTSNGFNYLLGLLKQTPFPYLSVRRRIDRRRVLELSNGNAQALVDEVVRMMTKFHPLVEFINTGGE